jgi:hypothetical protein
MKRIQLTCRGNSKPSIGARDSMRWVPMLYCPKLKMTATAAVPMRPVISEPTIRP